MVMILLAIALLGLSGLPACGLSARSAAGQRLTVALLLIGSGLGLAGVLVSLGGTVPLSMEMPWNLPWGRFAVGLDALSAVFLLPVFVVPALGSIYGLGYWRQSEHQATGQRLGLSFGLLAGSMALVVVARDGVFFLIAWEIMALSAWLAATVNDDEPEVRRAGWIYLVATHAGTLCLIALFALWRRATGDFSLEPAALLPGPMANALFVLAVIGFGFKAGLMPLHVWLPGAHASAPSHVSAVMSGVMLKMGVYGIVRMTGLIPAPADWWGGLLVAAGAVTGVAGIAYAMNQRDVKRLLAYSSIENIGIIAMGLGLALLGRSLDRADWVVLGLGGALLHVWNHALFKSLLFLNAGAVIHATGTRNMERLGGLARPMPRVAALFVVGAAAICALPPLNGFAGEWLLYLGLFRTLGLDGEAGSPIVAVAAVVLALIGALAVACFVKLLGTVFLGAPRGTAGDRAHDPPASLLAPMIVLAAACLGLGLFPLLAAPMLDAAAGAWSPGSAPAPLLGTLVPFRWLSVAGLATIGLAGATALIVRGLPRVRLARAAGTWDCGYARPTARMQYSGSSFSGTLVSFFSFVLWPKTMRPVPRGPFPRSVRFRSFAPDAVLDRMVLPLFGVAGRCLPWLRLLQQGQIQLYLVYFVVILLVLFVGGSLGARP
jgi:hydrogenase-4 component B